MPRRILFPAALLLLAACEPPTGAGTESAAAALTPPPNLIETARFDDALAGAGPDAERLQATSDALAARAEALRARATGLDAAVLAPGERDRLEAARPAAPVPSEAPAKAPTDAAAP